MEKHLRQTYRRGVRNAQRKKAIRLTMRAVVDAARAGDVEAATEALASAQKAIDKGAQRGIMHKRTAARRKSRLVRQIRAAQS